MGYTEFDKDIKGAGLYLADEIDIVYSARLIYALKALDEIMT